MRWGLIGTGPWAESVHAPSLAAHPTADLVAVWGRTAEKAAALAEAHDVESVAVLDELLERVDAVSLAVAPDAQLEIARRAAAHGVHVLFEKPVSTDAAAVQRFADGLPDGIRTVVFLTRLFEPSRAAWLRERLGTTYSHAHVEWISAALAPGGRYADSTWRYGAGAIPDIMPHVLSQVVPLLGEVVGTDVSLWAERDGLLIGLRHPNGATTHVRLTLSASPDEKQEWIRFDAVDGSVTTPADALDFVAAHSVAVSAIEDGVDLALDPLLSQADLRSAIPTASVLGDLMSEARRVLGG